MPMSLDRMPVGAHCCPPVYWPALWWAVTVVPESTVL